MKTMIFTMLGFVFAWFSGAAAAATIIIVNVVEGVDNGWAGAQVGWIVGAVIGFVMWEVLVTVVAFISGFFAMVKASD